LHHCTDDDDDDDDDVVDDGGAGERVLRQTRDMREQRARLREIEDELARLSATEVML